MRRLILMLAPRFKPAFLILGVQKAATTSLFNYLDKQDAFCGSVNKEVDFFSTEANFGKSVAWYHSFFRDFSFNTKKIFFEASPSYIYFPWVAQRICAYNPKMKMVVVLREPIARAYSAWKMYDGFFRRKELYRVMRGLRPGEKNLLYEYFFKGRTSFPSFEECIDIELQLISEGTEFWEPSLLRRGLYASQLERYQEYFPPEQLLVISFKDLTANPDAELEKIYEFVTGRSRLASATLLLKRNSIEREVDIPESTRLKLGEFYAEPNRKLEKLLGKKLNW